MKKTKKIFTLLVTIHSLLIQQGFSQELILDEDKYPVSGYAHDLTRNINHPDATEFQNIKKSVCYLYWYSIKKQGYMTGTGFIVNNLMNDGKLYLLTNEHNDLPTGSNVSPEDRAEMFISFDYEVSDPAKRQGPNQIRRIWRLEANERVIDEDPDIALYEIDNINGKHPFSVENSEIYQNVYALGWNLHPNIDHPEEISQIGHPEGDFKSFFDHPENPQFGKYMDVFALMGAPVTDSFQPEKGSSGSPVMDGTKKAFGMEFAGEPGLNSLVTLLENSWYHPNNSHLSEYLDPQATWISNIPGGYLKDLVPNDNTDYSLTINPTPLTSEFTMKASKFFYMVEMGELREDNLGHGILPTVPPHTRIFLTLHPKSYPNLLLYGSFVDSYTPDVDAIFKGESWNVERNFSPNSRFTYDSRELKALLLDYFSEEANFDIGLSEFDFQAILKITAESGSASVKAIKLPNHMPYNAVELFEPERLKNNWRSYKYHPSKGKNSELIYIDQLATYQGEEVPNLIPTGNNGGYLNLVNPNYKIGPIKTSYEGDNGNVTPSELGLDITIHNPNNAPIAYAVWIDYFNTEALEGRKGFIAENNPGNYSYNFVDDPTQHEVELLKSGTTSDNTINILEAMPTKGDMLLNIGKKRTTRMRISVKKGTVPPTQGEIFSEGEVEDYLIEIVAPTNGDIVAATEANANKLAHLTGRSSQDPSCSTGEAPADDLQGGTHSFELTSGCADGSCYNTTNSVTNGSAIDFSGSNVLAIDQCDAFIHEGFSERSVSMWIYPTSGNSNQMLYDEGGVDDGLAIRVNNGIVEAEASSSASQNEMRITASQNVTLNGWNHIMVVFDEGKLSLYQNDDPAIEMDGSSQFTSIPDHADEAALGGTLGTNAFGESNDSFSGLINNVIIWDYAVPASYADAKYNLSSGNTAGRTAYEGQTDDTTAVTTEPTFNLFPTPAKDHLNVLVEVRQAGSLQLEIVDLQGRQVYEMNRDHLSAGYHLITLSHLNLPAGPYVLLMQAGDVVRREKILIEP